MSMAFQRVLRTIAISGLWLALFSVTTEAKTRVTSEAFGKMPDGTPVGLVHWDLRESMRETDIEVILQRAKEKYPEAKPRFISDNGPQFIAPRLQGVHSHLGHDAGIRTSPNYPQSNGKLQRWHKRLKSECIRPGTPLSLEDAKRLIQQYVDRYNCLRLHSAIG